jgi:hypothetical protein
LGSFGEAINRLAVASWWVKISVDVEMMSASHKFLDERIGVLG